MLFFFFQVLPVGHHPGQEAEGGDRKVEGRGVGDLLVSLKLKPVSKF